MAGKNWRRAALGAAALAVVVTAGCDVVPLAGTGKGGFNGDSGPAYSVQLNRPQAIEQASDGTMFVADTENDRIRMITFQGDTETILGPNLPDGLGTLKRPAGLAYDEDSGALFISDTGHNRVLMTWVGTGNNTRLDVEDVMLVAGTGRRGYSGDGGPSTEARLNGPTGLAIDRASETLFVADTNNNVVRAIYGGDGEPVIATAAGTGRAGFDGDGYATETRLDHPRGVAVPDYSSNPTAQTVEPMLYISDSGNNRIRALGWDAGELQAEAEAGGLRLETIAGDGGRTYNGDGEALHLHISNPGGIDVTSEGVVFVAETGADRIRAIFEGMTISLDAAYISQDSIDAGPLAKADKKPKLATLRRPADVANLQGVDLLGQLGGPDAAPQAGPFNAGTVVADTGNSLVSLVTFPDWVFNGPTAQ